MIRHIVLLKWVDGTSEEQHQVVLDQLGRMPEIIPEIKSYDLHSDAGLSDGNANLVVVGDFDDADGYSIYANHPDHVQVITEHIKPIVASRSAIQYEF